MNPLIRAAREYKSPRRGPLTRHESETRRLAYALKTEASSARDFETAACEMAALVAHGRAWLVPVPASTGSTRANSILASHIARHLPGVQVAHALHRTQPTESQCSRHRRDMPALQPEELHLRATRRLRLPIYFVDNVATSGNTLRAAEAALPGGIGLVFAACRRALIFSL